MADPELSPLGVILERARGEMSKREAAGRAGISEGRWRQIVTGQQKAGGGIVVPANPRRKTVVAMARAVGADLAAALRAAGFEPDTRDVAQVTDVDFGDEDARLFVERVNADRHLIDEARRHLLNQYELLRRVGPALSHGTGIGGRPYPVRAVAEGGDPAHGGELSDIARQVREQYEEQEGTGASKDDDHR